MKEAPDMFVDTTKSNTDTLVGFDSNVTFGFTTIDRRPAAFEAVRTLRRDFPNTKIIVVDQNLADDEAREFYTDNSVDVHFVEYDCGLSAARNLMFDTCDTSYFFMLDDDVVEIPFQEMLRSFEIISKDNRVLVIGGRSGKISITEDGKKVKSINPPFNNFIFRKPKANLAVLFDPGIIEGIKTPRYDIDSTCRITDVVENFGFFNVQKYRELALKWDEDLKIGVEHLDFYFNTQNAVAGRDDAKILANPRMVAYDVDAITDQTMAAYRQKRFRQNFRGLYSSKWGISTEIHLGKWMNVFWPDGHNTIKWGELSKFSELQKSSYDKAGIELRKRYENFDIGSKRVTFIATSIDRLDAMQALAISIRARFSSSVEIIFGIQDTRLPESFANFAKQYEVSLVPMDEDIGLSAARNRLVASVETEYFVLCDDDFILDHDFSLGNAIRALDEEHSLSGVGGFYRDVIYTPEMRLMRKMERHFTFHAIYEPLTGTLIRIPFYQLPYSLCFDMDRGVMDADILQNLAVFRTSDFGPEKLHWDERMKISGEHMDFYVKNLLVDKKKFVFDPSLSVLHNRVQNSAYRAKRARTDGIELFHKKWNIQHEIDSELGVRSPLRKDTTWRPIENK